MTRYTNRDTLIEDLPAYLSDEDKRIIQEELAEFERYNDFHVLAIYSSLEDVGKSTISQLFNESDIQWDKITGWGAIRNCLWKHAEDFGFMYLIELEDNARGMKLSGERRAIIQ